MPLYTYKCKSCGKVVEKFHKMSVNGAEKCEDCGSETLRVFLPTGIIFKGSGFYSTDYKSGTSKANLNSGSQDGDKREEKREETRENKENREYSAEKNRDQKKEDHKTEEPASKSSEPKAQDKDKNSDKSKDKDKN